MKKLIVSIVFLFILTVSPYQTFAHNSEFSGQLAKNQVYAPTAQLRWDVIRSVTLSLTSESNGVGCEVFGKAYPESGATRAVLTIKLLSSSDNVNWKTTKTWTNQNLVVDSRGRFLFSEIYKVKKTGTYYKLSTTAKIYKGNTLLETIDELTMSSSKSLQY